MKWLLSLFAHHGVILLSFHVIGCRACERFRFGVLLRAGRLELCARRQRKAAFCPKPPTIRRSLWTTTSANSH